MINRLVLSCALLSFSLAADEGWVDLLNGKNLDGWVNVNCAPETWAISNGMLHCTGLPIGELRTEKQYENFIFECEWRHLKPAGNAGIFIWSGATPAKGQPFLRAIEVQVLEHAYGNTASFTTHGDIFPIHGSHMAPFPPSRGKRSFPSERLGKPSPEWNHYRIVATNGVIRLSVNGKEVSGGEDCNWRKGYIALESEGGIVDYRNLRLKELPGGTATPEQSAPVEDGWQPLYNGVDLRNWLPTPIAKPKDWTLGLTAGEARLISSQVWSRAELRFDFAPSDAASAATVPLSIGSLKTPASGISKTGWQRIEASLVDGVATISANGKQVGQAEVGQAALPFALGATSAAGKVSGVIVRELPLRVACVGDSITAGAGVRNKATESYPAVLQSELGDTYAVKNWGVSGTCMHSKGNRPYIKTGQYKRALASNPHIVVIALGTNDSKPVNWDLGAEAFATDYRAMIDAFRKASPAPRILCCLPPPGFSDRPNAIRGSVTFEEIRPVIARVAREAGCQTIDLHTPLADKAAWFPDTIHPNADGARGLGETVAKDIVGR